MVKLLNFVCCFTPIAINPDINGSAYDSGFWSGGAIFTPRDKEMGNPSKIIIDGESIILGFLIIPSKFFILSPIPKENIINANK